MEQRVLTKEAHGHTLRLAPPLVIDEADLGWGLDRVVAVVDAIRAHAYLAAG
jgi:ornithine--oxo-acid transaminase